jgi:alanyl-tRNA synthetase
MTPEQLLEVEKFVNYAIGKNAKMKLEDMDKNVAKAQGVE